MSSRSYISSSQTVYKVDEKIVVTISYWLIDPTGLEAWDVTCNNFPRELLGFNNKRCDSEEEAKKYAELIVDTMSEYYDRMDKINEEIKSQFKEKVAELNATD